MANPPIDNARPGTSDLADANAAATGGAQVYPAAPQAMTFGGQQLMSYLTGWSGETPRRHAIHSIPKRKGQLVEDFERGGRWIAVRLIFTGSNAAKKAQAFEDFVDLNPYGRLDHPKAGQYRAFCTGPQERVDFNQAIDRVEVNYKFIEAQLDAQLPVQTPDVATAAQNVATQQITYQQSVAAFMGTIAKAQTSSAAALNAIDAQLDQIDALGTPVSAMQGTINQALGTASKIVGTINLIATQTDVLNNDVEAFTATANDIFTGVDSPVGTINQVQSTLAQVQTDAQALEDTLTGSQVPTLVALGGNAAAGSSFAVQDLELLVDTCLTMKDAILAQLPPIVPYAVPTTINLVVLSQRLMEAFEIVGRDAVAYAALVLQLNHIPTPHAIPGGTVLDVPTE